MRLSHKHGLNPAISVCFYCGQDKDELVLLGHLPGDAKAPHRIVANYTPCKECASKMAQGMTVIEVTEQDNGARPIQDGVWPTGRYCVIRSDDHKNEHLLLDEWMYQKRFGDVIK